MVDPAVDPLLPRVLVNRLWQHHFGEGIVRSTDDFGAMGQKPSHPELLDWLAASLVESGWSIKAMHRLMLTSSTYRMSSMPDAAAEQIDPTNTLLHRMNVRRLEAEAIRDTLLAVSGQLEARDVWSQRARPFDKLHGGPRPAGPIGPSRRRRPPKHLPERETQFLEPHASRVRRTGAVLDDGPAQRFQRPRPGAHPLERPAGHQPGAGSGPSTRRLAPDNPYKRAARRALSDRPRPTAFRSRSPRQPRFPDRLQPGSIHCCRLSVTEPSLEAWADLCHVLINMKEFIFVD